MYFSILQRVLLNNKRETRNVRGGETFESRSQGDTFWLPQACYKTHRFVSELLDATVKKGSLPRSCSHISWNIVIKIRENANISRGSLIVELSKPWNKNKAVISLVGAFIENVLIF